MSAGNDEMMKQILEDSNPGWIVALANDRPEAGSRYESLFYIFDCKSSWIGAGAVNHEGFLKVRKWVVAKGKDQFKSLGGDCALKPSNAMATAGSPLLEEALHAAGHYFASTATFDRVLQAQGHAKGHWVCIVFTLADGSRLSRPAFASGRSGPGQAFMDSEELTKFVKLVIEEDLSNPRSAVASQIAAAGGAVFHESVRYVPGREGPSNSPTP
ncbi:hypothetical protein [Polaromonas sp.]|uniref:hypothetical protein n=1 Tax=Polaromonas sp. TaxID=1869339 RepID=UPI00352B1AD3